MPVTAFLGTDSKPHTFEAELLESLHGRSTLGFPVLAAVVQGLKKSDRPSASAGFSATQLLGCARKVVLDASFAVADLPANQYWLSRGSRQHVLIEQALDGMPDWMKPYFHKEKRLHSALLVEYQGDEHQIGIHGQYDLLYLPPDAGEVFEDARLGQLPMYPILFDHKNTSMAPKEAKAEHIAQVSIYAWLLYENADIQVENAYINYMDNKKNAQFRVETWDPITTQRFLHQRLEPLLPAYFEGELPDRVGPEGRWACGANRDKKSYCPFSDQCWPAGIIEGSPDGFFDTETGEMTLVLPLQERT